MYIYIFHSHKNIIQYLYRIACFEIIDQRVIATGDPFVVYLQRVTSLAFLCYVLRDKYRRSPCFFFFSTQMLFAEEASRDNATLPRPLFPPRGLALANNKPLLSSLLSKLGKLTPRMAIRSSLHVFFVPIK